MKTKHNSIFNLIEVFRNGKKARLKKEVPTTHCEQKHHHDFYCDGEVLGI